MWVDTRQRLNLAKEIKEELDNIKLQKGFKTNNQIIRFLIENFKAKTVL